MRGSRLCLIAFVILLTSFKLSAQTYSTGQETKKAEADFTELANYELAHPILLVRRYPFDEDAEDGPPDHPDVDASLVHMIHRNAERQVSGQVYPAYLPASPAPADTFISTLSSGSNIPPDTHGAVDLTYCVTAINSSVHIQKRNGVNSSQVSLDNFWTSVLPAGTGSFDPRVHYDPYNKRWILISDAVNQSTMGQSYLLVAVSKTSDPTGKWWQYAVSLDPTNQSWMDFPCIGFNNKWITITGNFFPNVTGAQSGAAVYVFNYASIMTGAGAPYTKISQSLSFTICPALTYDATEPNMFAVEVASSKKGQLELWKISGPVGSPVMTSVGFPTTTTHWQGAEPGNTDFAPQSGSANKFDEGDDRITNCTYRNHKLWCSHTVWLPSTGATRSSIMWWQMDTLANPLQNGMIDNATGPQFYAYPSIAVNQNDDALLGFSAFSSTTYASGAYALHMHSDPADSMRPLHIFRHGKAPYFQNFGSGKNRWGDYSGTCVDPVNNIDFWTIQESVPTGPANYWDTWWASVEVCPASASYAIASDSINVLTNDTITYTGSSPSGITYAWSFGGGTATPGTGAGPQIVKWTSSGWKEITVTVTDTGCSTTFIDSVYIYKTAGVQQVNKQDINVDIVPNPNNGSFNILFNEAVDKAISVKMADMQGRVVYSNEFDAINDNKLPVKTTGLTPGNYIVTIYTDGAEVSKKITITR